MGDERKERGDESDRIEGTRSDRTQSRDECGTERWREWKGKMNAW